MLDMCGVQYDSATCSLKEGHAKCMRVYMFAYLHVPVVKHMTKPYQQNHCITDCKYTGYYYINNFNAC